MSSTLTLLNLPFEIQTIIFTYLLPQNCTFTFISQRPVPPAKTQTWRHGTKVRWTSANQNQSHEIAQQLRRKIHSILLIHPSTYYIALRELYANNVFCFPDMFTIAAFADQVSTFALQSTRYVVIDGIGSEMSPRTRAFLDQHDIVEPDVHDTVRRFSGLKELTLGNIGPGLVRDMPQLINGREITVRAEDYQNWRRPGIELVAKLIAPTTYGVNPLANAHVICARHLPDIDVNKSWGYLRLFGTRLVRRGAELNFSRRDQEIGDVESVLNCARGFDVGTWTAALRRDAQFLGSGIVRGGTPIAVAG